MRARHGLRGGIQPPSRKEGSTRGPIRQPPLPPLLILPLDGARPLVAAGDRVGKGRLLAEGAALPVHASTSGRVLGIEQRAVAAHSRGACLLLEPDGEDRWEEAPCPGDSDAVDPEQLRRAVAAAGIAGLGGGGFPTARKLAATTIHTLVVNGIECEPYVTADDLLMREDAATIAAGIQLAARMLGHPERILVGIEDDKPEAIAAMTTATRGTGIGVVELPTRYPSGGERQLIALLTGAEVPAGGLPQDIGVLCLNVGTLHALARALGHGEPLLSRVVTVAGEACPDPANYRALLGTPAAHLLAASGCRPRDCAGLVLGGALMGERLDDPQTPIIRTSHCLLALSAAELPPAAPQPCIRCGLCARACPVALLPQQLHRQALAGNDRELDRHHLTACIECGACNYVCPSAIPLAQQFRAAKQLLHDRSAARHRADRDRARFAAHQARSSAQTRARSERAPGPSPAAPPVQTAADLVGLAMARAATPLDTRRQALERAALAAADRLGRLEAQLDALPPDLTEAQRNSLRARIEQARIDLHQAERRLDDAPREPAGSGTGDA